MKKILFFISVLITPALFAQKLQADFMYARFNTPNDQSYIETYVSIQANSIKHIKKDNGMLQGAVDIKLIFRDDSIVKDTKQYTVLSPETAHFDSLNFNFLDQQRFLLPNGKYTLEIDIADHNNPVQHTNSKLPIVMNFKTDSLNISDIQLVGSYEKALTESKYSKSGYNLIPYTSDFFPATVSKLKFYAEIYNTDKALANDSAYLVNYYIANVETGRRIMNLNKIKRQKTAPVNILLVDMDISALASGSYNLKIDIIDRNKKIIAVKSLPIFRSNNATNLATNNQSYALIEGTFVEHYVSMDTLRDYVLSTRPISTESEIYFLDNELKKADLRKMQEYFYFFWQSRSADPEEAWKKYLEDVMKVNTSFGTHYHKGYDTDRGRIYLKYGAPSSIDEKRNNEGMYPYEVWQYTEINHQSNRSFVFYCPETGITEYILLHSDVAGELRDNNWMMRLQKNK